MSPVRKLRKPLPFVPPRQRRAVFSVLPTADGRWCAKREDGLVAGTFFGREDAIRFARSESTGIPVLVLHIAPVGAQ